MRKRLAICVMVGLACSPVIVAGHEGAMGVVKERMELMKSMGQSMKALGEVFKGQVDYDPAVIEQAAREIQALAGAKLTKLFPQGSTQAPSEALPMVWEDWERFAELAELSSTYASALVDAAGNPPAQRMVRLTEIAVDEGDLAALAGQSPQQAFGFLAKTCLECHETFRMKKE